MEPRTTILMAEDDAELAALISEYLDGHGFDVKVVDDGASVTQRVLQLAPDLVILDLMLPHRDGLSICRALRPVYTGPILMLTSRSGWVDEIVGLEVGADDYVGKPVEPRLLLARIKTLLRRFESEPVAPSPASRPLRIDDGSRTAYVDEVPLNLTSAEFELLRFFVSHAGEELTRERLYRELLGLEYDGTDRTIDVRVSRLRAKLSDDGRHPFWIKTVRGVGYFFGEES